MTTVKAKAKPAKKTTKKTARKPIKAITKPVITTDELEAALSTVASSVAIDKTEGKPSRHPILEELFGIKAPGEPGPAYKPIPIPDDYTSDVLVVL